MPRGPTSRGQLRMEWTVQGKVSSFIRLLFEFSLAHKLHDAPGIGAGAVLLSHPATTTSTGWRGNERPCITDYFSPFLPV